jgi:hydroxymethylbilane synthase
MILKIGTRGSPLALWQARHVASILESKHPDLKIELNIIKTQGDKILDTPLAVIGSKGLFTKEIEEALLDGRVDFAVHSLKDLPTDLPDGLELAAIMKREDPRDVFISRDGRKLAEIRSGERIGTSSLRRKAFLLNRFPGLEIVSIRGNVDTRIRKIETENLAGAVLAAAGVLRLGFGDKVTEFLESDLVIPAIGQGALAIETRKNDTHVQSFIGELNDPDTARCAIIERAFLRRMGGGCQVPMAAHCTPSGAGVTLTAAVVHPDGKPMLRQCMTVDGGDESIGVELANKLIESGADKIMKSVFSDDWKPV